jgi:O-antigen/teichoic acid export membrane protein
MTRYLTQEEYGQIAMFQILVTALSAVVGLSVHSAASRKFFDKDVSGETLRKFNGACMQILFCSASVAMLAVLLFGDWMAKQLNIPSIWIVLALIVATAGFISQIRLGQWQIRNKAKRFGIFQVLQSLCNAFISILLVVSLLQGAQGRIDAQVGVSLVFSALALSFLYRDRLLNFFHWDASMLKEALAFGVPMIPHVVGGFLLLSIDRFVINSELGIASVGIYMVAIQLSSALKIIFHSLNKAYMPWLFGQLKIDNTQTKVKIVKLTYLYYVALLLLSGIIFLIGPFFVTLIAGEQYKDAGSVIGLLCLGNIFNGMYLMITNYIFYSKKTFWLSIVTILSGTINIGLLFLLIEPFGLVGAGIAYAVSNLIMFLLAWFVSNKAFSMPWFDRKLLT